MFISVLFVVRNESATLERLLATASETIAPLVSDYELIVVDNASSDDSIALLKDLTGDTGLPNLQVYGLTKEVDYDTAAWVGLENALGDFVAVADPFVDDICFLPEMLEKAMSGADVVFATNLQRPEQSWHYRAAFSIFNRLFRWTSGVDLAKEAPQYRVLTKRVINFILHHRQPALTYRHLPATGGFARANLTFSAPPSHAPRKRLGDSIDRGMRMLVSTTRAPMRLVTALSLFGTAANLLYSFYVLIVWFFKSDVAPGWVSLSLQQSGMFFLISLVLLVLGEYILNMASASNEGPLYHVGQEFTSARMTRREKLNIEVVVGGDIKRADVPVVR
ncbi:Glycosyl transferase, group 2 family [Cupriavidus sp. U2]|nr:Glycosyl transferase, group 2 family [Cupriavidus sp. U2]